MNLKWFLVFLLSVVIWLIASSLYIYDLRSEGHHTHGVPPQPFQNVVVDIRDSFLGHDPEKVICYRESHRNFYVFTFFLLTSVVGLVGHGLFAQKRNNRKLAEKNAEIQFQRSLVETANHQIFSSIRYASQIQSSLLPSRDFLKSRLGEICLIYKPKDVVSGDFYFCKSFGSTVVVVLGDCTGHGVPGAFLTVRSLNILENLIPAHLDSPARLLEAVQATFEKDHSHPDLHLGLDLSVCIFRTEKRELSFAGAHQFLVEIKEGEIKEWKGTRRSIVSEAGASGIPFSETRFSYSPESNFYLFSDGISDQFTGDSDRKLGRKQFLSWLKEAQTEGGPESQERVISEKTGILDGKVSTDGRHLRIGI